MPRFPLSSSLASSPCQCTVMCTQMSSTGSRTPSLRWYGRITPPCHNSRVPSRLVGPGWPQTLRLTHLRAVKRPSSSKASFQAATAPLIMGTTKAPAPPPLLKAPPMRPVTVYMLNFFRESTSVLTLTTVLLARESRHSFLPFGQAMKASRRDLIRDGEVC